jgi:hypothetical protein
MSLHPGIARHLIPMRPIVLGRQLQAYSLWHSLILEAIESPIVVGDDLPDITDLQIAVHICSHPAPGPMRSHLPGRLRSIYDRARYHATWEGDLEVFEDYVSAAWRGPIYFQSEARQTFDIRTSVQHFYTHKLMSAGYPYEVAWATSPGMARWLACNLRECAGEVQEIRCKYQQDLAVKCGHRREDYPID